jgi:glucosamine--fructose-6-phosphate aminotransferase (isomerizing)
MSHGVILALIGIQYAKNITVARSVAASITTLSENAKKSLFHVREIDTIVQWLATAEHVFTIGRLSNLGAAREAALKLKEVCYIHAESQEAGELKHGSLALIDETFPTIAFLSDSPAGEKTLSAIQEIQARNGEVLAVGPKKIVERSNATHNIIVPQVHPFLQALINVVPIYQLTYQIALVKQLPIDKPRNLAKAVTVE